MIRIIQEIIKMLNALKETEMRALKKAGKKEIKQDEEDDSDEDDSELSDDSDEEDSEDERFDEEETLGEPTMADTDREESKAG